MANPLDATIKTALGEPVTKPYYLLKLGFDTPAYYSSIANLTWDTHTWVAQSLSVVMGDKPTISIFNADFAIGNLVLAQGTAGRTIDIWEGYQNDSAHPSPEHIFSGEMGKADVSLKVKITCKRYGPKKSPRHFAIAPTFNHVPKNGSRLVTPSGIIILESS